MSSDTWPAGIESPTGARHQAGLRLLLLTVLLSACVGPQPGSEAHGAAAANEFLELLVAGRSRDAWKLLTPRTQSEAYDDSVEDFAADVVHADWSSLKWRIGRVSNYDISWGVYVEVTEGTVPAFLVEREIAGKQSNGMLLLVQVREDGTYKVAGQAMDQRPGDD